MEVEFLDKFNRDLEKINQKSVKKAIEKAICKVEEADGISQLPSLKKLSGHKSAYRIRIGDYRIGIFIDRNLVQFGRIAHRKDIYKLFP